MTEETSANASSTPDSLLQSLSQAIDHVSTYEPVLDQILTQYLAGDLDLHLFSRMTRQDPVFALFHTLSYPKWPLDDAAQRRIGPEGMQILDRLHDKYSAPLRPALRAIVEHHLFGIDNTWNRTYSQPIYYPDDEELLMEFKIVWGTKTVFQSLDRVDDFIRLGMNLLGRCADTLDYAVSRQLKLDDSHHQDIARALQRVEDTCTRLRELHSSFDEHAPPEPPPVAQVEGGPSSSQTPDPPNPTQTPP